MDYSIYAICSGQLILYVGQTRRPLKERERLHRSKFNNSSSRHIPYDDWNMQLLEVCPNSTREYATSRERYYYDLLKPFYNEQMPGRSQAEYYQTPERKAMKAAYAQTPKCKAYRAAYQQTPERKAAHAARQRAYRAKKKLEAQQ